MVKKLLDASHSADESLLAIWIKGYVVETEYIRNAWIRLLAAQKEKIDKRLSKTEDPDDAIGQMAVKMGRKTSREQGVPRDKIDLLEELLVNMVFGPNFVFSEIEETVVSEDIGSYFSHLRLLPGFVMILQELNFEAGIQFFHKTQSLSTLQEFANSTRAEELDLIQTHWVNIAETTVGLFGIFAPGLLKSYPDPRRDPIVEVGAHIIPMFLHATKCGKAKELDKSVSLVIDFRKTFDIVIAAQKISHGEQIEQEKIGAFGDFVNSIAQIWGFPNAAAMLMKSQ